MEAVSNATIVDVRTPEEYAGEHFTNAINIPFDQVAQRINEFNYSLEWQARNDIEQKKSRASSLSQILGVPVKKISNIPDVFSLSETEKQIVIKPALDK